MFVEDFTLGNGGRWRRELLRAEEPDERGVVVYSPPQIFSGVTWVCINCGYEYNEKEITAG